MTLNDKKVLLSSLKDIEKSARKQLQNITQIINKYESEINVEELKRRTTPKEFKYQREISLFLHNRKPIRGIRYFYDNVDDIITFMGLEEDPSVGVYKQIHLIYDNNNSHIKFVDEASNKVLGYGDYLFESFGGNSFFIKTKEEVEDTNRFIMINPFTKYRKYKDDVLQIELNKELVIPNFTHRFKNSKCAEYLCSEDDIISSSPLIYFKVHVSQFSSLNDHPSCVSFFNWYIKQFTKPRDMFNYAFYYDCNADEHRIYLYKTNYKNEIISVDIVNDNDYVAFIIGPYERIKDIRIIKSEKELNRHFLSYSAIRNYKL